MTTRRNFLKGAAASGIAFCSCGMLDAAHAQPKGPRLPVKVNGKRVVTVDVHAHCYFREAINLMGDGADKVLPPVKGVPEHFIAIEQRLKEMDAMAIDMEVLSINPFWYGKDRDTAAQEGLRHLVAQVGASQVLLGTDHRIPWQQHPVDHVFATTTLSDKQKIAILGGNAARLFGMKLA